MDTVSFNCPICGGPLEADEKRSIWGREIRYRCKNEKCKTVLSQVYDKSKSEYWDKIQLADTDLVKTEKWHNYGLQYHTAQEWQSISEGREKFGNSETVRKEVTAEAEKEHDPIAIALRVIGWLEIIGGVVLFIALLPGEPEFGYRWLFAKYVPAISWLFAGLVSGILFIAIARILDYLKEIRSRP